MGYTYLASEFINLATTDGKFQSITDKFYKNIVDPHFIGSIILYLQEMINKNEQATSGNINDYDLRGANIANFANNMQDNASQIASNFSQNINQNIGEITKLIDSLRNLAQGFPEDQREEALVNLDDLQEDITTPEKQKPQRLTIRIKRLLAIAAILTGVVTGASDFSNNVLDLAEKLGIPIEFSQLQLPSHYPTPRSQ